MKYLIVGPIPAIPFIANTADEASRFVENPWNTAQIRNKLARAELGDGFKYGNYKVYAVKGTHHE